MFQRDLSTAARWKISNFLHTHSNTGTLSVLGQFTGIGKRELCQRLDIVQSHWLQWVK